MNYKIEFENININICHFLYQSLQPFLEYLLNNINGNDSYFMSYNDFTKYLTFHKTMFEVIAENFEIKNSDNQEIADSKIIKFSPLVPYYNDKVFKCLRDLVYKKYSIVDRPLEIRYKVLYVREENQTRSHNMCARQIHNYEGIIKHFDLVLKNLSIIPFPEQIKLFSKISHLVCPEGTHITNVLFMNKKCRVLAIVNTGVFFDDRLVNYDCWQKTFGGEEFVDEINTNVIATKLITNKAQSITAPWYHRYNDHIDVDEFLEKKIIRWLNIN